MILTAYAESVEPTMLNNIKGFILGCCRFEYSSWPASSYVCVIWKNNVACRVAAGASWSFSGSNVYLDSNPEINPPTWAPVALKCVAEFYRLNEDPEVVTAIDGMIETMRRRMQESSERATASSSRSRPVRKVALHNRELRELGYYNVAPPGESERMEWRDHEGNPHEIDEAGEEWTVMEI
jgi:hypothetical protein